jgi:hypothetical protein
MDIEDFYAQNEARRQSAEVEFGSEWSDTAGNSYELSWVEATGELYLMMSPEARVHIEPLFGDVVDYEEPTDGLQVRVIATYPTLEAVESQLAGWQEAEGAADSITWLANRVREEN